MRKNFEEGKHGYEEIDFNYYLDEVEQQSGRPQLLFEIQQLEHDCLLAMQLQEEEDRKNAEDNEIIKPREERKQ